MWAASLQLPGFNPSGIPKMASDPSGQLLSVQPLPVQHLFHLGCAWDTYKGVGTLRHQAAHRLACLKQSVVCYHSSCSFSTLSADTKTKVLMGRASWPATPKGVDGKAEYMAASVCVSCCQIGAAIWLHSVQSLWLQGSQALHTSPAQVLLPLGLALPGSRQVTTPRVRIRRYLQEAYCTPTQSPLGCCRTPFEFACNQWHHCIWAWDRTSWASTLSTQQHLPGASWP